MGKVITSDNTIKRLTELERQRCCNRNQFLPTYNDFPTTGEDNVLYIDKEKSKIYLWNGSIYITADDLVGHTNIVATTPYDSLNPLTGWIAPTTPYFGNTATVLFTDDIIVNFTFNGTIWEEKIIDDTAISGIKTANTVYVDGTYGDDTTGQRESRDFPFQTLDAAIAVLEDEDLLKVFPGDYTQNTAITKAVNIHCDNGVNWSVTGIMFTVNSAVEKLTIKLDSVISNSIVNLSTIYSTNINSVLVLDINKVSNLACIFSFNRSNILVDICDNSWIRTNLLGNVAYIFPSSNLKINTYYPGTVGYLSQNSSAISNFTSLIEVGNLVISDVNASIQGVVSNALSSDTGVNKTYYQCINNSNVVLSGMYSVTPNWDDTNYLSWGDTTKFIFYNRRSINYDNSTINQKIVNFYGSSNGVFYDFNQVANGTNKNVTSYISGYFNKGVPVLLRNMASYTGYNITLDLNVVCETSMGVNLILNSDWPSGSTITITGKITSKLNTMPCISIIGDVNTRNTNSNIILKDLLLINNGDVSTIRTNLANPQNIIIQNVVTNSLVVDANITEVGQSIIRNTNYK